jgi:PAS domain S-box-containing protein
MNTLFKDFVDQVIITDPEGKILYVNNQIEKVTGYTAAEALGQTPALWGRQMSAQFYRELWEQIKVRKEGISVGLTNRRKDGSTYQAHLRISPVLGLEGEVKMYVGIETVIRRQS